MSSTADVLFSKTQQRLLAALFSETAPEGLSYAELLRRTAGGAGAIHRELQQFVAAGLVVEKRIAGRRLFRANPGHAVYGELSSLAKKLLETPHKLDASTARSLAQKYMWWTTPAEASKNQARLVAQVMNIGDYDDVQRVARELGDEYLRNVLRNAEAGQFDERSWSYWHYRLGLARPGELPPMPARAAG
jgi:hypothetical protein